MRNELLQQYAKECGFYYRGRHYGRAVMFFYLKSFVYYLIAFPKLDSDKGQITIRNFPTFGHSAFETFDFENEADAIAHLRAECSAGRFNPDEATVSVYQTTPFASMIQNQADRSNPVVSIT